MIRHTAEHESARPYQEIDSIKRQIERIAVDEFELDRQRRRLEQRMDQIDNSLALLNPSDRIGWGVAPR